MKTFEAILLKYNCLNKNNNQKVNINEIEAIVKFSLPDDYKNFIENYLGFEENIGHEYLQIWDAKELIEANKSYQIFDYLPNTLGIGSNGAGEFIAIEWIAEDNSRVILCPFTDLDKESFIEIGTSFTNMFERFDNSIEWFT
jgi:SMI1 / KNR4 family (SUKH-1)